MIPKIAGFITRADAGLRKPRSVSYNIDPSGGGVTGHYGGPAQNIGSHSECVKTWRGWQNYHMDTHGWVDIAYSGAVCDHGYALAGRGWGVRTAANGTNNGNYNYLAIVWLGGDGETPTDAAMNAFTWWVQEARKRGAGNRVVPHSYHKSTGCPGNPVRKRIAVLDNKAIKEDEMSSPKDWDNSDWNHFQSAINNMIVKHTDSNFAWHIRNLEATTEATLNATRATLVEAIAALRVAYGVAPNEEWDSIHADRIVAGEYDMEEMRQKLRDAAG